MKFVEMKFMEIKFVLSVKLIEMKFNIDKWIKRSKRLNIILADDGPRSETPIC